MSTSTDYSALLEAMHQTKPLMYDKGNNLLLTMRFIRRLLCEFEPLRHVFRYDDFTATLSITRELPDAVSRSDEEFPRSMQDHDVVAFAAFLEQLSTRSAPPTKKLAEVIDMAARGQRFSSLKDSVERLPAHDGECRLENWLTRYLGVEESPYSRSVGWMFLVQMIARAMDPGCKADYVLVLEGDQGAGKSQAVGILAGRFAGDDLPAIAASSKEHKEYLIGRWVIELAELDGLTSQKNQRAAKAFFTTREDKTRLPYANRTLPHPRTCVFVGTTNETKPYLTDDTGNRRYWPVRVGAVRLEELEQDRDQLLAEARERYNAGVKAYPSKEQELLYFKIEQSKRGYHDGLGERLQMALGTAEETTVIECLELLDLDDTHGHRMAIGKHLRAMGYQRVLTRRDGVQLRMYRLRIS